MGQLTVIAGRTGPVWLKWGRVGSEFQDLDALRNEWKADATIHIALYMDRAEATDLIMDLMTEGHWIEGNLWSRQALIRVLHKMTDVEEYGEDEDVPVGLLEEVV